MRLVSHTRYQVAIEFVAAVTHNTEAQRLLRLSDAMQEATEMVSDKPLLYPDQKVLRLAMFGVNMHGLSWFGVHLWAFSEANEVPEPHSADFQYGRVYGSVIIRNPFVRDP